MAKRKIKTLEKIIDGPVINSNNLLGNNLINKGGNIIRVGIAVDVTAKISVSVDAAAGSPVYDFLNEGEALLAGTEYVFEFVATGANNINFQSDTFPIQFHKLIVENFIEK